MHYCSSLDVVFIRYFSCSSVYNKCMAMKRVRIFLGLILLIVSISLLVWSLLPVESQVRRVPIRQDDLTYPTPVGFLNMEWGQV